MGNLEVSKSYKAETKMTIFGLYITTCKRYDADVDALIMEITDAAAERIKSLEDQLKRERREDRGTRYHTSRCHRG